MKFSTVACASLSLVSVTAFAASIPDGLAKSVACQACHGGDGIALSADVPNLAGQQAAYLKQQLQSFKSGDRKHDVMNPIAKQLSDGDIENLAAYWNSLPSAGTKREPAAAAAFARKPQMNFPADFPAKFVVYRTDESVENKTITKFYANDVAVKAAKAGRSLPNGSAVVVEATKAKLDSNQQPVKDAQGHLVADVPAYYSAMEARDGAGKDIPELIRNGDWVYALFTAQKVRRETGNYAMCFGCHKAVAQDSYVFSSAELKEKAKQL